MKKMILFKIEMTCDIDDFSSFFAAENAAEAEVMARQSIIIDHLAWWEEEGRLREVVNTSWDMNSGGNEAEEKLEQIYQERVDELNKMRVTMLIEMGEVIIR